MKPNIILSCVLVGAAMLISGCAPYDAEYYNATVADYVPATAGTPAGDIRVDPFTTVSTCSRISPTATGWKVTPTGVFLQGPHGSWGVGSQVSMAHFSVLPHSTRGKTPVARSASTRSAPTSAPRASVAPPPPLEKTGGGAVGSEVFP